MEKKRFLTLEDRFRELPPDKYPFTTQSIAEELGRTPEAAKLMIKAYQRQSEKALLNIEGNHVKDADLFDLKTRKLEDVGRYVILPESWKRNATYLRASWGLYLQNAWKILRLGAAISTSALNRYAAIGADVRPALENTQKLLEEFKPPAESQRA